MYFSFRGCFIEEKKKWLRETFVGGHNKIYSYNYDTVSNMWGGGCKYKRVVGVFIDGPRNSEKYRIKWEKKYKHRVYLDIDYIVQHHCTKPRKILVWCEKNINGKYTFVPVAKRDEDFMNYLFTAADQTDAMGFKLRWL